MSEVITLKNNLRPLNDKELEMMVHFCEDMDDIFTEEFFNKILSDTLDANIEYLQRNPDNGIFIYFDDFTGELLYFNIGINEQQTLKHNELPIETYNILNIISYFADN